MRHRVTGAGWGLLVLAGFAAVLWLMASAWVSRYEGAHLFVASAILVAVVADGVAANRAVRRAQPQLRGPEVVEAGLPVPWTVQVREWRRPVAVSPQLLPGAEDVLVASDRPGSLVWPPLRRGVLPFVVADLTARGPMGLVDAARRHHLRLPTPLHITPLPVEQEITWPRPRAVAFGTTEGAPIGDDLFRSVRPYRSGDERRSVHWKATAHHGELMVRESDGTGIVLVRLVVDLPPVGPDAEEVAGVALWLGTEALARGWVIELVTLDAAGLVPVLAELGVPFGRSPSVATPMLVRLPTVVAPVRSAVEIQRRLATAAHGRPEVPTGEGWRGRTCTVSAAGVEWS